MAVVNLLVTNQREKQVAHNAVKIGLNLNKGNDKNAHSKFGKKKEQEYYVVKVGMNLGKGNDKNAHSKFGKKKDWNPTYALAW